MKPFADHFSAVARSYAAARPTYPPALFDFLATLAPGRHHAWDCAAGSGQATLELAARFEAVTATDASAAQLQQAPPHPRVQYRVATAERSGLPDGSTDLVTVAQAVHWLDLDQFYAEVRRVLVPEGITAIWCYGLQRVGDRRIDSTLEHFYGDTLGPYWAPERRLVETGYRTLPFPFKELPTPVFDMALEWSLRELTDYLRTWSATERFRRERGHDPVDTLEGELASAWGAPGARRRVHWPLSLRVGRRRMPV
ncbi:MAG TPA: class I SAM-dependent methyltransferase [Gemmatimonadales bacterium]|nr:class I SAM-dependent methyltransferase [Gemmatimonadales bacterium]